MITPDLKGRVAVITGSSSGIGAGIAIELAKAGADIAVTYHSDEEGAAETAAKVRETGVREIVARLNVSDRPSVADLFEQVKSELGPVDILINNAGIDGDTTHVSELEIEDWDKLISVNLRGTFLCTRAVLSGMKERGRGVILNITSVHEVIPWAGHAGYCAAKAGIAMMTRSLALELQDSGVRVLNLAPGAIRTPINEEVWDDPEKYEALKDKMPLRRIGGVEEVARVACMLVSENASYMTGVTTFVDGGMTAYPSFSKGG